MQAESPDRFIAFKLLNRLLNGTMGNWSSCKLQCEEEKTPSSEFYDMYK